MNGLVIDQPPREKRTSLTIDTKILQSSSCQRLACRASGRSPWAHPGNELIPPEVPTPPDGGLATGMLIAVFAAALFWIIGTGGRHPHFKFARVIGSLIGVAFEIRHRIDDVAHSPIVGPDAAWLI